MRGGGWEDEEDKEDEEEEEDEAHTVSTRCVMLARRLSKCVLSACRAPGSREMPPPLPALLLVVLVVEDGGTEWRRRC